MSAWIRRAAPWLALAASFAIYLVPLAGPHMTLALGPALLSSLFESSSDQPVLWTLTNFAAAAFIQAFAWAAFFFLFRRPGWMSAVTVILTLPALFVAIQFSYFLAIPTLFLIESESASESGNWTVACQVEGADMSLQRRTALGTLEKAGEAWIWRGKPRVQARLTMPNCRVGEMLLQANEQVDRASQDGGLLYRNLVRGTGKYKHWYLPPDADTAIQLAPPTGEKYWAPTLSSDGLSVAWLALQRDHRRVVREIRIIRLEPTNGRRQEIVAELPLPASYRLQAMNTDAGEFIVVKNSKEVFGLGMDGHVKWGPARLPGFDHLWDNFRLIHGGWVAWDSYRDNERYRVAWSLPQGEGMVEIPRGRGINDVSVQPSGGLIAIGTSGNLRIGNIKGSVFVLRTDTGSEVFRRFLPVYARPHLAFLGDSHLAVSRYEDGKSWLEVLSVPGELQQPRE